MQAFSGSSSDSDAIVDVHYMHTVAKLLLLLLWLVLTVTLMTKASGLLMHHTTALPDITQFAHYTQLIVSFYCLSLHYESI